MSDSPTPSPDRPRSAIRAWIVDWALRHRYAVSMMVHIVIFTLSLLMAYLVWFDAGPVGKDGRGHWITRSLLYTLPFFLVLKLAIFARMKLFRGGWRYASLRDVVSIVTACWIFVAIAFAMIFLFAYVPGWLGRTVLVLTPYFNLFPKGVLVLDFLASVFLLCAARLGVRLYREELRPIAAEGVKRVLMVGAGNAAESILRQIGMMHVERYRVIGLVDDNPGKRSLMIHGSPVLGTTDQIREICDARKIDEIIIAIPSATQKQLRRVIELCTGTKLKFQSLPSVSDLIDGRVTVSQIRPVDINDLLGREAVQLDDAAIGRFLRGRRILITGAGGSIGSEMCRQVSRFAPAEITLVEQAETALFEIERELHRICPDVNISACICDIYDRERVLQVWRAHRPDVVIHAAAHKHVPLMERDPCEAVKNNILGTRNVADASCRCRVAEFVMISTDKAVNPSSVMGASKRVAEIYTQGLNGRDDCPTQFKAVRFGNVLGSAGSVVPIFRRQIAAGGPVQVTHPDMMRYFMTIPEAAQLVLQAAATGSGGQIFLLDMGDPVRIVDLAQQMITLSGFVVGQDIEIEFTGVRPGEKLFEELRTAGEDITPTVHPKVLVWQSRPVAPDRVQEILAEMFELRTCGDRQTIIDALRRAVPEYQPPEQDDPTPLPRAQPAGTGAADTQNVATPATPAEQPENAPHPAESQPV